MMGFLLRAVISAIGLWLATQWVTGVHYDSVGALIGAGVVLGVVNAIIRPILKLLSCPVILLTLGLFVFVINAFTLWLASQIAVNFFHVGFYVNGFLPAFFGALIVSIVSVILNTLVREAEG